MKNFRVVRVEYDHPLVGTKETYALQRRIGFFFWYSVYHCDSVTQCMACYRNVKNKKERIIRVLHKHP